MTKAISPSDLRGVALFAAAAIIMFAGIAGPDIYFQDEAKNAGCAKEMLENGEFIVPTFNCELRAHKPPLHYYFMMLSYSLFGATPFAARFFSALCGVATVMLIYRTTSVEIDRNAGLFSGAAALAMLHFPVQMKQSVPDPYLIFLTTASILAIFTGQRRGAHSVLYTGYALLGLAVLAKGPVAIILVGLTFLIYLLITKTFTISNIKSFRPVSGGLLALVLAVPWYFLVDLRTSGNYTDGFFMTHNFGRFFGAMEGHGGIFLITWAFVLVGMLPVTLYFFQSAAHAWRLRASEPLLPLALSAFMAVVLFFTLSSTRLPNYTAPAYPFAAILCGTWLSGKYRSINSERRTFLFTSLALVVISIGLVGGVYYGLRSYPLTTGVAPVAMYLAPLVLITALATITAYRGRPRASLWLQGVYSLWLILAFAFAIYPAIDSTNPVREYTREGKSFENMAGYTFVHPAWVFKYGCVDMYHYESRKDLVEKLAEGEYDGIISRKRHDSELEEVGNTKLTWSHQDLFEASVSAIYRRGDAQ